MYFSKNSRYVLQKAYWLSPSSYFFTCLRRVDKNLSIKFPKEDPTKPPLRVNIPKDPQPSDSTYSKLFQNTKNFEPRSKSLIRTSTSQLSANLEEGFLQRSESDTQLTKFKDDLVSSSKKNTTEISSNTSSQVNPLSFDDNFSANIKENDYNEGLVTSLTEQPVEDILGQNYLDNNLNSDKGNAQLFNSKITDLKAENNAVENAKIIPNAENSDDKTLYIIIDVPDKNQEKFAHVSTVDSVKEPKKINPPPFLEDDFSAVKSLKSKSQNPKPHKLKIDWRRSDNSFRGKSKSLSKLTSSTPDLPKRVRKSDSKLRFEVHEIDDAATYVFHLRFKKNFGGKPTLVGCVPEKEVNIRNHCVNIEDTPVRIKEAGNCYKTHGKDVIQVEDVPESVTYSKFQNQPQIIKSENYKDDKTVSSTCGTVKNFHNSSANSKSEKDFFEKTFVKNSEENANISMPETTDVSDGRSLEQSKSTENEANPSEKLNTQDGPTTLNLSPNVTEENLNSNTKISPEYSNPKVNLQRKLSDTVSQDLTTSSSSSPSEVLEYAVTAAEIINDTNSEEQKSIDKKKLTKKISNKHNWVDKKKRKTGKLTDSHFHSDSASGNISLEKAEADITDFKTCSSMITISSEKAPNYPSRFSAAYPPTLSEAIRGRSRALGLKRDSLFHHKWTSKIDFLPKEFEMNPKCLKMNKVTEFPKNSIFFETKQTKNLEHDFLESSKKEIILNVAKSEDKNTPKLGDNMINVANENLTQNKEELSVDSLTMMKKVKKIVDFDLNNAIKLFQGREEKTTEKVSSVMVLKDNQWQVDNEELQRCIETRKSEKCNEIKITTKNEEDNIDWKKKNFKGEKSFKKDDRNVFPQIVFPTKKEKQIMMKLNGNQLNSVITYTPQTGKFAIDKKELKKAILLSKDFEFNKAAIRKVEEIIKKGPGNAGIGENYEFKKGDSILVFDEETQTWKVDFSILEKREEQLREEQELTKRSELILETIEKLEKGQMPGVSKPDSREKRIFDYGTEEWKIYPSEKKTSTNQIPRKYPKLPFKESDAEEIRRNNSDLYENLFVAKKKETEMNKNGKEAPGLKRSGTKKEGKGYDRFSKVEAKDGESTIKNSETKNTRTPIKESETKTPSDPPNVSNVPKEDDNFWESFLKMNILPQNIPEVPKIKLPPPPATSPDPPPMPPPMTPPMSPPLSPPLSPPTTPPISPPIKPPVSPPLSPPLSPPVSPVVPPPMSPQPPKVETPKTKIPAKKIEEPRFKIPIPFRGDKKIDDSKSKKPPKSKKNPKPENPAPPAVTDGAKKEEKKIKAPPPPVPPQRKEDPPPKNPPTIGAPKKSENPEATQPKETNKLKAPSSSSGIKISEDSKTKPPLSSLGGKKDKSATEHYISDNIVEMSKNTNAEKNSKIKSNKIETVKLNITSDKRMPSKIMEINLNKKCEENAKEQKKQNSNKEKKVEGSSEKVDKSSIENKNFYKNFEKYKTPFSDPEYEEKTMKINSDMDSNPNLKKLDNWNKTLVLQDLLKPPENIESWLKDETDKMATLLLKVLQEAADGKPRKKTGEKKPKSSDKSTGKGNPYDNIRKKQETTAESFLYKIRPMDLDSGDDRKAKFDEIKLGKKPDPGLKSIPVQSAKTVKPSKVVDAVKIPTIGQEAFLTPTTRILNDSPPLPENVFEETKPKFSEAALQAVDSFLGYREIHQNRAITELTDEIPGPEILKKISNAWKLLPILSCQMTIFTMFKMFQLVNMGASLFSSTGAEKNRKNAFSKLFSKYGPIVNVQGPLSGNVILIHKPEHLMGVFEQDLCITVRSVFDSLEQSRRDTEEKIQSAGVSTDWSKPEWNGLKRALNDPLVEGYEKFFNGTELAGESLISNMRRNRNGQNYVSEDFMEEIKRWSTEGFCNVFFEKPTCSLEGRNDKVTWVLEPDKLYIAIEETTDYLSKCERGFQTWRLLSTPSSVGLGQAYRALSGLLSKQLYQAELSLKSKNEILKSGSLLNSRNITFVESMLLFDGTTVDDVTCNLIDILLIGINTMSSALGFLLYNLAQNMKVQNKLLKEVKEVLPEKNSHLDYYKLHSLKYLQACLKESLRLHTPIPIFFRMLQNDILLSNYVVPKGTCVIMDSKNLCMKEQIFDEPEKFIPERWMSEEQWMENVHPFFSFPFCHGPRGGLAKRIAEMQLWSCIAKVVRNFQTEYQFGEIQETEGIVSFPDKPLKLNFVERDE